MNRSPLVCCAASTADTVAGHGHGITRADIIATAVVGGFAVLALVALAAALCLLRRARSNAKVISRLQHLQSTVLLPQLKVAVLRPCLQCVSAEHQSLRFCAAAAGRESNTASASSGHDGLSGRLIWS